MGQQQGKQGVAAGYPPPMEGVASSAMLPSSKAPPVSRIKGLKPRQPKEGSWSPALSGTTMSPLGAGPPSGAAFGLFNELSSGKITLDTYLAHHPFTHEQATPSGDFLEKNHENLS